MQNKAGFGAAAKQAACRPLKDEELAQVRAQLARPRDRALFDVGLAVGFRISGLLSLTVGAGRVALETGRVYLSAAGGKGNSAGHSCAVKADGLSAIRSQISTLEGTGEPDRLEADAPLFQSRKRERDGKPGRLRRAQAYRVLRDAFEAAAVPGLDVPGLLGTHSLRKTWTARVYRNATRRMIETNGAAGEAIELVRRAGGWRDLESVLHYLPVDVADVDAAVLG